IKMMLMECQFNVCACRRAEMRGERYVYDVEYDRKLQELEKKKNQNKEPGDSRAGYTSAQPSAEQNTSHQPPEQEDVAMRDTQSQEPQEEEPLIAFSPATGTFRPVPSPTKNSRPQPEEPEAVRKGSVTRAEGSS